MDLETLNPVVLTATRKLSSSPCCRNACKEDNVPCEKPSLKSRNPLNTRAHTLNAENKPYTVHPTSLSPKPETLHPRP